MEMNSRTVVAKNKNLAGLREEQRVHDEALEAARAQQAKVRATVMQKEKGIKKAEKALDGKVHLFLLVSCALPILLYDVETRFSGDGGADYTYDTQNQQRAQGERGGGAQRGEARRESRDTRERTSKCEEGGGCSPGYVILALWPLALDGAHVAHIST
jgi:hypothetical protein